MEYLKKICENLKVNDPKDSSHTHMPHNSILGNGKARRGHSCQAEWV